jgi:hypothetical protein
VDNPSGDHNRDIEHLRRDLDQEIHGIAQEVLELYKKGLDERKIR